MPQYQKIKEDILYLSSRLTHYSMAVSAMGKERGRQRDSTPVRMKGEKVE